MTPDDIHRGLNTPAITLGRVWRQSLPRTLLMEGSALTLLAARAETEPGEVIAARLDAQIARLVELAAVMRGERQVVREIAIQPLPPPARGKPELRAVS